MTKRVKSIRDTEGHGKYIQRAEYAEFFINCSLKTVSDAFLERIADDMLKWLDDNPEKFQLHGFLKQHGLLPWSLKSWTEKNEKLKHAWKWTMYTLGQRREEGAIKREYDGGFVKYCMPLVDEDFKHLEEWRSKLKESSESGDKIVIIERFPDVPTVPRLKKDE